MWCGFEKNLYFSLTCFSYYDPIKMMYEGTSTKRFVNALWMWFLDRSLLILHIQTIGRTPENMINISIVPPGIHQDKDKINFKEDDVLQLQCIGEVESINGIPSKVHTCILSACFT